jgi:hypothetical protein
MGRCASGRKPKKASGRDKPAPHEAVCLRVGAGGPEADQSGAKREQENPDARFHFILLVIGQGGPGQNKSAAPRRGYKTL